MIANFENQSSTSHHATGASSNALPKSNGLQNFKYSSLQSDPPEIRLLEYVGNSSTFRLHHVSLHTAPPYIALSYFWGDPTPRHSISVNGRQVSIASNLYQALATIFAAVNNGPCESLWSKGDNVLLWADGICINQQDVLEKNVQVKLMSDIYRRSRGTLGYLGIPSSGKDPAEIFDNLITIGSYPLDDEPESTTNVYNDISDLASCPWFTRCWVMQEVVLAKNAICLYGDEDRHSSLELDLIGSLRKGLQTPGIAKPQLRKSDASEGLKKGGRSLAEALFWAHLRVNIRKDPSGLNLVKILSLMRSAAATDIRDKVYSVLGVLKEQDRRAIKVDYSKENTVEQVYTDLAKYIIATPDCMKMLAHAGKSRHLPKLPSWVPDWSREDRSPLDYDLYRAAIDMTSDVRVSASGEMLHLKALPFGNVITASPAVDHSNLKIESNWLGGTDPIFLGTEDLLGGLEVAMDEFCNIIQTKVGRLPGPGTREDAIWRTMTADIGYGGNRRATAEDQKYYDAFMSQNPREEEGAQNQDYEAYYPFVVMVQSCIGGRRLCAFNTGKVGLVPDDTKVGDWVAIFPGSNLPFIIRHLRENKFELIGHCFVYGAMDGEILKAFPAFLRDNPAYAGLSVSNLFKEIILV